MGWLAKENVDVSSSRSSRVNSRHTAAPPHAGRYEALGRVWSQVRKEAVRAIVRLAEKNELYEKSPDYARALDGGTVVCGVLPFEIPDRGAQRGLGRWIHCRGN